MNRWKVQPSDFNSPQGNPVIGTLNDIGRVLCDIRHILEVLIPQNDTIAPYDEEAESFLHVDPPSALGGPVQPGVDKLASTK